MLQRKGQRGAAMRSEGARAELLRLWLTIKSIADASRVGFPDATGSAERV